MLHWRDVQPVRKQVSLWSQRFMAPGGQRLADLPPTMASAHLQEAPSTGAFWRKKKFMLHIFYMQEFEGFLSMTPVYVKLRCLFTSMKSGTEKQQEPLPAPVWNDDLHHIYIYIYIPRLSPEFQRTCMSSSIVLQLEIFLCGKTVQIWRNPQENVPAVRVQLGIQATFSTGPDPSRAPHSAAPLTPSHKLPHPPAGTWGPPAQSRTAHQGQRAGTKWSSANCPRAGDPGPGQGKGFFAKATGPAHTRLTMLQKEAKLAWWVRRAPLGTRRRRAALWHLPAPDSCYAAASSLPRTFRVAFHLAACHSQWIFFPPIMKRQAPVAPPPLSPPLYQYPHPCVTFYTRQLPQINIYNLILVWVSSNKWPDYNMKCQSLENVQPQTDQDESWAAGHHTAVFKVVISLRCMAFQGISSALLNLASGCNSLKRRKFS